ncbi:MAG: polysaccharide biosynthesis tyrosine autokinase [Planctomycetota bacterium]
MSELANQPSGVPGLPSGIPSAERPGNMVPIPPSRVSVVGGPTKGSAAPGGEKGGGLFFALTVIRRWWLIAAPLGLLLATAGSAVVWLLFERQYEAAAWLKVEEKAPYLAFENKGDETRSKAFFQTQIELIRSPLVMGWVVQRPEIAQLSDVQRKTDPIAALAKQVKVSPVGESELFKILYVSNNAEAAAAIVNAITESYFKLRDQSDSERSQKVVDLLEKEKANRLREVIRMRQDLSDMTRQLTGRETYTAKPDGDTRQKSALADLQGRLVTVQVEKAVLAARVEAAQHEFQNAPVAGGKTEPFIVSFRPGEVALREAMIEKAILERPEVARATEAMVAKEARQKEIELRMKDGKSDPIYSLLTRQITDDREAFEALKKSLRATVEKQTEAMLIARRSDRESADSEKRLDEVSRMRSELQGRQILEQRLQAEYDKELRSVKQFSGNTLELEFKYDELTRAEKVFELIGARLLQLQTERMAPTRVSLLRMAEVPQVSVEPYPFRSLALAIFGGLCAPFGLAFAWERWVQRVSNSSDLPKTQGLTILGEIAQMPRHLPLLSQHGPRQSEIELRVYQESIDNLQTTLTLSEEIGAMRIIAVTSAVSGEGKTSVASQLALSLSRSIKERVLVIDGDMRSPDIHRVFQIDRDPGLAAVLAKECELADAIVTTWSDRVHFLPAGKLTGNPLNLLAGGAWPELLARIPADYRYVIIDTPPILATSEALVLAKGADAALICTMRDRSRTEQVLMVQNRLRAVGGRLVGVVLNGVPTNSYLYRYGNYDYLAKQ